MRMLFRTALLAIALGLVAAPAAAQPPTLTAAMPVHYDFAGYTGAGLGNPAAAGQLDTRSFQVILAGAATSQCLFGAATCSGTAAFMEGTHAAGVITGGLYDFTDIGSAPDFGFQPSSSAFSGTTGGSVWLAIVNGTGAPLATINVGATLWTFNDQGRGTIIHTFVRNSTSGTTTIEAGTPFTSTAAADAAPAWMSTTLGGSVDVSSLSIAAGATFYVEFTIADATGAAAGSGSRDEFALDDIAISVMPTNCGNGVIDTGETCDDGAANGSTPCGCQASCHFAAMGVACGPAPTMPCDAMDTCDGAGACAARVVAAGMACRPSTGLCDPVESCDGVATTCPADVISPSTTVCRPSAGACDVADHCDGTTGACPDAHVTDGTTCDDGLVCNGADACMTGACMHTGAPSCADTDACTVDTCVEAAVMCMHTLTPAPACCNAAADCDDSDACTTDGCTGAGGTCTFDPVPNCCNVDADCDDLDACTTDTCDTTAHTCAHAPSCDAAMPMTDGGTPMPDAGHDAGATDGGGGTDARVIPADAGSHPRAASCGCSAPGSSGGRGLAIAIALLLAGVIARRRLHPSAAGRR